MNTVFLHSFYCFSRKKFPHDKKSSRSSVWINWNELKSWYRKEIIIWKLTFLFREKIISLIRTLCYPIHKFAARTIEWQKIKTKLKFLFDWKCIYNYILCAYVCRVVNHNKPNENEMYFLFIKNLNWLYRKVDFIHQKALLYYQNV